MPGPRTSLAPISVPPPRSATPLVVGPQLQRRPPLHSVGPVLGREQGLGDLGRAAVGLAEDRRQPLVAVLAAPAAARRSAPAGHRRRRRSRSTGAAPVHGSRSSTAPFVLGELEPATIRSADPDRDAAACPCDLRAVRRVRRHLVRGGAAGRRELRSADRREPGAVPLAGRRARRHRLRLRLRLSPPLPPGIPLGPSRPPSTSPPASGGGVTAAPSTPSSPTACATNASTSPAPASPCPTPPVSPCTRPPASSRSASTGGSAGSTAPGTTSAGGSWSSSPRARMRPRSRCRHCP